MSHPITEGDLKTFLKEHPQVKVVGDYMVSKDGAYEKMGGGIQTEEQEQAEVCRWLDQEHPEIKYFSTQNGARTTWATANKLKKTGMKSGIPDLIFPQPMGPYHGMYLELKRLKGSVVSDAQRLWLNFLDGKGYYATIAYGAEHAKREILNYQSLGPFCVGKPTGGV